MLNRNPGWNCTTTPFPKIYPRPSPASKGRNNYLPPSQVSMGRSNYLPPSSASMGRNNYLSPSTASKGSNNYLPPPPQPAWAEITTFLVLDGT
jgi:hypothetical protein